MVHSISYFCQAALALSDTKTKVITTNCAERVLEQQPGNRKRVTDAPCLSNTHLTQLLPALFWTFFPPPGNIDALNRIDIFDVHRPHLRSIQFIHQSRKIFAHNLHLTLLPREVTALGNADIPVSVPSIENEEHRLFEPVPLLVEDET